MSLSARVRIRPMVRRDLPQVPALELACFGREAWPLQAFKDLLAVFAGSRPARGAFWVAEDQTTGGVVGYAGVEVSALWGEMDIINIAVAASHRRRGVGCLLIERIVRLCRQRGVSLLWLRVRASNRGARRFYRRMGFQERGRFAGYYLEPDESAVIMAMEPECGIAGTRRRDHDLTRRLESFGPAGTDEDRPLGDGRRRRAPQIV